MLKYLAILGFLLTLAQASNPLPWQTTTGPGNGGSKANSNSQSNNHPSAPSMTVRDPAHSPKNSEHASEIAGQESEHSVTLTNIPPLTIKDRQKTILDHVYDWGPWFFGFFLAIAGGVQLKLLRVTWEAIKEQKAESAIQTQILRDSVAAAQKSAEAARLNAEAVINAERARLLFEVEKGKSQKGQGIAIFTIYAVNHGRTPAELVRIKGPVAEVCGDIDELPIPMKTHPTPLPDKWHIMPNSKCFIACFEPASMSAEALELAHTGGVAINEQERVIYGEVLYRDGISEIIRSSRYCYRFNREPFRNIGGSIEPAGRSEFNQKT